MFLRADTGSDRRMIPCKSHPGAQYLIKFELLYLSAVRSGNLVDILYKFRPEPLGHSLTLQVLKNVFLGASLSSGRPMMV